MAKDLGVRLSEHCVRFIHQELARGRFTSESEIIEAALLAFEEHEVRRAQLLAAFEQAEHHAPQRQDPHRA